ncbi:hypothetical protein BJ742DRAFT_387110 [Cladochytrium replicatum]|nr:hypothetical protein BJ742DRAFT_387110 [Cladochytrium replicatum]
MSSLSASLSSAAASPAVTSVPTALDNGLEAPNDLSALLMSFLVILVSEVGDKTFFIAAVMAMKNPRLLIFAAAMSALGVMTVLSAYLGHVVPNLISKRYTEFLASTLFFVFGMRMLRDGYMMTGSEGQDELEEVTQELNGKDSDKDLEKGEKKVDGDEDTDPMVGDGKKEQAVCITWLKGWSNLFQYFLSPVFVQTFVLTFLAEWGDRSQIATIALAGAKDFWFVTLGSLAGHAICSALAVIGGRMIATKISVRTVTLLGAVLFLIFGFVSLYGAMTEYEGEK